MPNVSANVPALQNIALSILSQLGLEEFELSCSFVTEEKILQLNSEYRNKPNPTDVLSFEQFDFIHKITINAPYIEKENSPIPKVLGDIVICPNIAAKNANQIGQNLSKEIVFLMIHGILHLCGHDHMEPEEAEQMYHQQRILMEKILEGNTAMIEQNQLFAMRGS